MRRPTTIRLSEQRCAELMQWFAGRTCPACGRGKQQRHCLDRTCYFSLLPEMRARLWLSPLEHGAEFFEAYQSAIAYLKRLFAAKLPKKKLICTGRELLREEDVA
jgi:hypothetical protein